MRGKPPKFSLGKDIQNWLIYFFIMVFECRKALSDSLRLCSIGLGRGLGAGGCRGLQGALRGGSIELSVDPRPRP